MLTGGESLCGAVQSLGRNCASKVCIIERSRVVQTSPSDDTENSIFTITRLKRGYLVQLRFGWAQPDLRRIHVLGTGTQPTGGEGFLALKDQF